LKSIGRVKGDDRILGDSEFVLQVLKEADEKFDRYYELKQRGYTLCSVEERVCKIFDLFKKAGKGENGGPGFILLLGHTRA